MKVTTFFRTFWVLLSASFSLSTAVVIAAEEDIVVTLEEPAEGSTYSGVSNLRGWAVARHGIDHIELLVDGVSSTNIPSGGRRVDVARRYPDYPDSDKSGFSMAFNYSNLAPGQHIITIRAVSSEDGTKEVSATFNVTRFENPFIPDPASISLSGATCTLDERTIIINDLTAEGKRYEVRMDWRIATQGFAVTQITPGNENPGDPIIEFTYVPPYGSFDDLQGQIWHVNPLDYKVAVYIYVSGWWTKPYFDRPLTSIQIDGSWRCDITTGGIDERATRVAAFLMPNGYNPPLMFGGGSLPPELENNAVAEVEITRSP